MTTVFTVGHSTRASDELVSMLRAHGVAGIADVRRFAGSRRLPHFNAEHLAKALPGLGMSYLPCPLLGGRRKSDPDSTNTGWRNESFRAYADYMQTPPFLEGLDLLMEAAGLGGSSGINGATRSRDNATYCTALRRFRKGTRRHYNGARRGVTRASVRAPGRAPGS